MALGIFKQEVPLLHADCRATDHMMRLSTRNPNVIWEEPRRHSPTLTAENN